MKESNKEKQHFIPRFYLKKFSKNQDEKSIGVYLKDRNKFISNASIEGQCQKSFYYGEDGLIEDILMKIETPVANLIKKTCEEQAIPKKPIEDYFRVLHFAINLHMRNPTQANVLLGFDQGFNEHFSKFDESPDIKSFIENKLTEKQSIVFALSQSWRIARICLDLSCKLIVNQTNIPFIISDNPIIKYNSIAEIFNKIATGFTAFGLQIFFPISPSLMILFFDTNTYQVIENEKGKIFLINEIDIQNLNLLQILNSSQSLYFNETITESYILSLIEKSKSYTKPNEIIPMEFGSYFFQSVSDLRTELQLPFITPYVIDKNIEIVNGNMILSMRPHAKKMREFLEKEEAIKKNK